MKRGPQHHSSLIHIHPHHQQPFLSTSFPIPCSSTRKLPSRAGTTPAVRHTLSLLVAITRILLFHSGIIITSLGSVGIISAVGETDQRLAGGFELFEGLLEEGGRVLVGAATLHVGGDVGPEGGGVGVFDLLFCEEEVLVLFGWTVVSWVVIGSK